MLHEALRLFDAGAAAGLALHDRETTTLVVSACCLPGSPWYGEHLSRALGVFERFWSANELDPRMRLDTEDDGGSSSMLQQQQ